MITISLCMIVKNEEAILARCLDSIADLMDEIIIVDTGSTDTTKEIAARYTEKIYDFVWCDDFSAARNFAFSKAGCEYIYSADADEILDEENRQRFSLLKEGLLPEVDIVQMKYGNQLEQGTVYNFDEEYRPKLFKRLRTFIWEEPIHEMVRLEPVIFDSDIIITHKPTGNHADRDLKQLADLAQSGQHLSKRLLHMYAQELFLNGQAEDFARASVYFQGVTADTSRTPDEIQEACCVAARAARLAVEERNFLKYTSKLLAGEGCSEICTELGIYYESCEDYEEAIIWYYNAAYETTPILSLQTGTILPLQGLVHCYQRLGLTEQESLYLEELRKLSASEIRRNHPERVN